MLVHRPLGGPVTNITRAKATINDNGNEFAAREWESVTLSLQDQFGQIDIYVFDQLLRGNIERGMRVLDAGCGYGRNLVYMLREGYEISRWMEMAMGWSMCGSSRRHCRRACR